MKRQSNAPTENLPQSFIYSLGFHALVFAALVVRVALFPPEPILQQQTIRVDMVGLPDRVSGNPPPAPKPPPAPVPAKKEPKKANPKPTPNPPKPEVRKSQKAALDKLAEIERKQRESRSGPIVETRNTESQYLGNVISPGTSLTGLDQIQHENYLDDVHNHVMKFWNLPQWLSEAGYRARVIVLLDRRGYVTKISFIERANNDIFNQKVVEALQQSSPFPEPPRKFEAILATEGLELRFPQ